MTVGPFDTDPVIARIKSAVPAFRLVAGAAELDAAMTSAASSVTPAAYVLLARESASESRGSSQRLIQAVSVTLSVVVAARNYRQADLGTAAGADLRSLLTALRTALLGWVPAGSERPLDFQNGRLERRQDATLWWQDLYRAQYRIEVTL